MPKLRELLFGTRDPYSGFDPSHWNVPLVGWGYDHPVFEQVIFGIQPKPRTLIEVGTFQGASAIHMAGLCKRLGVDCELICIDTFIGSLDHWLKGMQSELLMQFGFPRIYDQFIANVLKSGCQHIVTPCPMVSTTAAAFLRHHRVQADAIYLDASHEFADVRSDIDNFWPLLRGGGVLFGDDYDPYWPGVVRAVQEWARQNSIQIYEVTGECSIPGGKKIMSTKWAAWKPDPAGGPKWVPKFSNR